MKFLHVAFSNGLRYQIPASVIAKHLLRFGGASSTPHTIDELIEIVASGFRWCALCVYWFRYDELILDRETNLRICPSCQVPVW